MKDTNLQNVKYVEIVSLCMHIFLFHKSQKSFRCAIGENINFRKHVFFFHNHTSLSNVILGEMIAFEDIFSNYMKEESLSEDVCDNCGKG